MKRHRLSHTSQQPDQCEVCDKLFSNFLKTNSATLQQWTRREYLRNSLRVHMLLHTGEGLKHECSICSERFNESSDLKEHMSTHAGEKPHECKVCYKRFSQSPSLKTHTLTHIGEKPHVFEVCFTRFSSRNIILCAYT